MSTLTKKPANVKKLTQIAILVAIEAIFCFVPILGSIPVGPIVATTAHIPVILAGVLLGVSGGAILGFCFGLFSFMVHSFILPTITSFVFTPIVSIGDVGGNFLSLVICFVPRILLGVFAALIFNWLKNLDKKANWSYVVTGCVASLLHTVMVLGMIYLFFKDSYAVANGLTGELLLGAIGTVILTNGVMEAILASVVTIAVSRPLQKIVKHQ